MGAHRKSVFERLEQYAERSDNGCLEWRGALFHSGYGKLKARSPFTKNIVYTRAHRFVLACAIGRDLLPEEYATHLCDNPRCVDIAHLRLGDATSNNRETVQRGRYRNGFTKTDAIIRHLISVLFDTGLYTKQAIADIFGVTQPRVYQILKRRKHGS